jgi:trigger factor
MQVNETLTEGLRRELQVTIPAAELGARLASRLEEMKDRVRLKGFRPGKVPVAHLRRIYGKAAMAEVVETMVGETSRQALAGRGERVAVQPEIAMTEDEAEAQRILNGEADLVFTMSYEIVPDFEVADYKGLRIERPIAQVGEGEVDERLERFAAGARSYSDAERPAQEGDRVTFSYVGKIDGEPFEGGADEDAQLVLGSRSFIPGFEEGLQGLMAGEEKTIEVRFPDDYPAAHLAGRTAQFDVAVKAVAAPDELRLDDEFAKRLGIESIDRLRETVRRQIESEHGFATRQKMKRQLLDALDERHSFPLPDRLVDQEFENIWRQVTHDVEHHGRSFEDEGTTEEEARKEYRAIAERRVRLGLVLSRIGETANIQVSEEEMQRALAAQLRNYPGREQQVLDYYQKNPGAVQGLRAPIFEEKVVDYILEFADVTDVAVSREELLKELEEEAHHDHDHAHHHDHAHDHDDAHDHHHGDDAHEHGDHAR